MSEQQPIDITQVPLPDDLTGLHDGVTGGFQHAIQWLVDFVHTLGYPGIFIMTFLESTFMPIPSEVTMIPVGYLVQQGHMNLFNYYIAYHYGRRFMQAYGRYFFFGHDKMEKLDQFFAKHGEISTFTGRLVPGLRHFISFPAGLAHMDLKKFCLYTGAGGAIWMSTLIGVGYFIGGNKEMLRAFMPWVTAVAIGTVVLMVIAYIWHKRVQRRRENAGGN